MTATITEQPTLDALEARVHNLTFPETVVATPPTGEYSHERNGDGNGERLIYVTAAHELDPGREDWVGTTHRLVPAPSGAGWLDRETPHRPGASFDRYLGAVVSPTPVNGRHYRSIGDDQFLVRFNDEDHLDDRGRADMPWTLLRGVGEAVWPVPNDGLMGMSLWPYVEVEFEEAATEETAVRTAETTEEDAPATEEPAVPTIGNTVMDPTMGMAQAEEDGTVLLDPEMVAGEAYVLWDALDYDHSYSNTHLVRFVGDDPTDSSHFVSYGYWDWSTRTESPRWSSDYYAQLSNVGWHWAKAAFGKPEPVEDTSAVTTYETLAEGEREEFRTFNREANRIAKQAGWCGEYDRIVSEVGMKGRYKKYDVNVSATFTFSNNNPSGAIDTAVAEYHDADSSLSLSTIEYSGTMDVTVTVENATDADDAESKIGTSDVEEAIQRMMTNASGIDVSDYDIESTDRVDGDDDDDDEDEDED